jgi:dTDP-4-dehydrorhamnose reductase
MRFLVVGRGWTGIKVLAELSKRNHEVSMCSHHDVFNLIEKGDLDWVINCAGVTGSPNVDACELDKENTILGNAVFPILLSGALKGTGIKLAHFSSGCIYTGDIQGSYAEPNFFGSTYSMSKGVSDIYLKDHAMVFRIRMPFTGIDEKKNYLTKVYNYAKNAKLIDAGYNSLTDLDEAVSVACELMEEDAPLGPYNLVNEGSVNMHELAEIMEITPEWFTPEEFRAATAAGRSTCTIPGTGRMRPVKEALADAVAKMKMPK